MSSMEMEKEAADRYSLRGRVFHRLREDILDGKYRQHDELKENTIARELGVSRTPVREALHQLELEGLVSIVPNKGAYVNGITAEDVRDIYRIRARLEGLCAAMAADRISREQLDQMEEILCLADFHEKKGHYDQLYSLDNKFHDILYEASGSKMLEHLLKDFHHYVQRVRRTTLSRGERAEKSTQEHRDILASIRDQNPKQADELATLHIMNTISNISQYKMETLLATDKEKERQEERKENGQD